MSPTSALRALKSYRWSYRWWMLAVLSAIFTFSDTDRIALSLMLPAIKNDLALTDTQLGLLTGLAFAFFYTLMGYPLSRWADRGDRVRLVYVTTFLWSVMVCLSGAAINFAQLLATRIGVGIGEAGCTPLAFSLMGDAFSRTERPKAMSVYMTGGCSSLVIGYLLSGWLEPVYGWRMTFVLLACPGLVLTAIAAMTLREPRRAGPAVRQEVNPQAPEAPRLSEVVKTLWHNRAFRNMWIGISIISFFLDGLQQWLPSFLARGFHANPTQLGVWLAFVYGIGGMLSIYGGGALITRYFAGKEHVQLRLAAGAYAVQGLMTAMSLLASQLSYAMAIIGAMVLIIGGITGPIFATIQTLAPSRMRATALMLMYLLSNLIGQGLGPLAAGALSDALAPTLGEQSLRYALLALCPGCLAGTWLMWRASLSVQKDLQAVAVLEAQAA